MGGWEGMTQTTEGGERGAGWLWVPEFGVCGEPSWVAPGAIAEPATDPMIQKKPDEQWQPDRPRSANHGAPVGFYAASEIGRGPADRESEISRLQDWTRMSKGPKER